MSSAVMKHILAGELIGKDVEIVESTNLSLLGLKGKIINETKMTITLVHHGKQKMLFKNAIELLLNGRRVPGRELLGRPEERIKWR